MALNIEEKPKKKRNKNDNNNSDASSDDGEQSLHLPSNKSVDTSVGTGLTTITGKSLHSLQKSQERSRNENQSDGVLVDEETNDTMPVEINAIETNSLANTVLSPSASFTNLNNIPNLPEFPQIAGIVDESKQQNDVFYQDTLTRNNEKVAMLIDYFRLPTHYKKNLLAFKVREFSDTLLQKQYSRSKRMVTMIVHYIENIVNVI